MILLQTHGILKASLPYVAFAEYIVILLYCAIRFVEFFRKKRGSCFAYIILGVACFPITYIYKSEFISWLGKGLTGTLFDFFGTLFIMAFIGYMFQKMFDFLKNALDEAVSSHLRTKNNDSPKKRRLYEKNSRKQN